MWAAMTEACMVSSYTPFVRLYSELTLFCSTLDHIYKVRENHLQKMTNMCNISM